MRLLKEALRSEQHAKHYNMANPNRDLLIKAKIDELRKYLKAWSELNQIVDPPLETLEFSLYVLKTAPAVKTTSEVRMLSPEDWDKILRIEWKEDELFTLNMLREFNNNPIEGSKLFVSSRKFGLGPDSFNIKFRKTKLPYRIKAHENSENGPIKMQLFHIRFAKGY